jgi:hypothetical protein
MAPGPFPIRSTQVPPTFSYRYKYFMKKTLALLLITGAILMTLIYFAPPSVQQYVPLILFLAH